MRKLGIDNGKPLTSRDLAEPLVGADEMVDGGGLMELKGDAELKGIESANLSLKAVVRNEFPGTDEVDVEQTEDLIPPASDVSREESTEPGEFENVKLPGADLDGKDRDRLDQRQASDEQLGSRLADDPIHRVGAEFVVIMLDQGAGVEKVASHQKRSARSSSMTTRAMESLIVEVPARTSSRVMLSSASFVQEAMAS